MPYPTRLLSPGEEIVREFRPHWTSILGPLGITFAALALVIGLAFFAGGSLQQYGPAVVAVLWILVTIRGIVRWLTTQHVITNERVIHRTGFISKRGKEIPLEMINTISFAQSVFERMVGSGDLVIESAGETGQTLYTDIPDPEGLQTLIYKVREDRMLSLERGGQGQSKAEQIRILSELHDQGKLSDEEFAREKDRIFGQS
ncbi:MAG TPA: PH domain-containing protein [Acidimicrobiia bacterium]|nr:PH domain-containing protein [Acidimicrobiia bacterium]